MMQALEEPILSSVTPLAPYLRLLLIFSTVLMIVRLYITSKTRSLKLPPGPRGVPILGFLPFLGRQCHLTLTKLAKHYGPVYQVFLGNKRLIVINDHRRVREAFRQAVFSGRPDTQLTKLMEGYGVINAEGALWKEQRAFLHSVLRDFGAKTMGPGRNALERKIQIEVQDFIENVWSYKGTPFRIRPLVARAVSSVIGALLMSVTFANEDHRFRRLLDLMDEGFRLVSLAMPVNFMPALRFVPLANYGYQKIKRNREETSEYFRRIAEEHKKTLDPDNIRDFIDAYLIQLQKKQNEPNGTASYFSEEQLIQVLNDIFSAGLETVTTTLEWATLFLVRHPEVQQRMQEEIDRVIGSTRRPQLDDLAQLPYTEATILEVLRRGNVIVLGNTHATLGNTELAGYHIPKGSHVVSNLWAVHMDPELWPEPEKFKPERFLRNGKVYKPDFFMPFSVGRRMCLGDVLTKMELFLFLSSLLQQFDLRVPKGQMPPSDEGEVTVSLTPRPFTICAVPRDVPRNS